MIRDLAGLMAILVLFKHSRMTEIPGVANVPALAALESLFGNPGVSVRMPLFLIFSGWLFWRKRPIGVEYGRKIVSRARLLLGPYLLWGGFCVACGLASTYCLGRPLPGVRQVLTTWVFAPSYHLWFLRHLFIAVLLSPFIGAILANRRRGIVVLAAFGVWQALSDPNAGGFGSWHAIGVTSKSVGPSITPGELFFFGLGGFVSIHKVKVPRLASGTVRWAVPAYILTVCATFLFASHSLSLSEFLYSVESFAGVLLVIGTYRPEWKIFANPFVQAAGRYSCFIYFAQEPLLGGVRGALLAVSGTSAPCVLLQFFITPLLTAKLLVSLAGFLECRVPKAYRVLIGGRNHTHASVPTLTVVEGGRSRERSGNTAKLAA